MSDIAYTSLTRSQIVDEILRLNDVEERQAAEIERLRKAIEYACHSLDLGRITSTVASELRAAVGQATSKEPE